MRSQKSPTHAWLQLLRAPNLFTVPGDPFAGFLLVSGGWIDWRLACAVLASLCFYAHGLLLNDLADLNEDRRERPDRPLPSGAARLGIVRAVAVVLAALALLFSFAVNRSTFFVGLALLAVIVVYNLWSKRIAILGPLNMGLCRGLSLLLGAFAAQPAGPPTALLLVWFAATGLTIYIALVTNVARIETHADPPRLPRTLSFPGLLLAIVPVFVAALDRSHPFAPFNVALYAVSAYTLYAGYNSIGSCFVNRLRGFPR